MKRITLRPQSDLLEILQDILPLESPTQHSGNKYLKTRKISELVTKHRQVPLLSTMLKQQDHDTGKAVFQSYGISYINKLHKLDNTPIKYSIHEKQYLTITHGKRRCPDNQRI